MGASNLEEFLAIVRRDLGAEDARVLEAAAAPPEDGATLRCDLPDGRVVVAGFAEPPADIEARRRRLEMLAAAFVDVLPPKDRARLSRPPPARSLHEELGALAQRAGALEAVIIDGHSPVVWGWAHEPPEAGELDEEELTPISTALHAVGPDDAAAERYGMTSARGMRVDPSVMGVVPRVVCTRHRVLPVMRAGDRLVLAMSDPSDVDAIRDVMIATGMEVEPVFAGDSMTSFLEHLEAGDDTRTWEQVLAAIPEVELFDRTVRADNACVPFRRRILARRAIAEVRALPEMAELHRGGHLRSTVSEESFGYVARSFASIYVVVLVYGGPFDELLAKRALSHVLPIIERLVAALPPLDPGPPTAGVAAIRGRRRR